jgi:hypothetical protein
MEHTISKVKVYQTTNYKVFKKIEGNRILNSKKIDRIIKEIQSGNDVLDEVPVLVKESKHILEVLDGQHRLEVAQKLNRPVHYIIHKTDMTLHNVAKVNSNTEKWKSSDFVNCYVATGNENYKKIEKFHNAYGIAIGSCLTMLTYGNLKRDSGDELLMQAFQTGTFEVKKYKEAVQVAEICKTFSAFDSWNSRPFVAAISRIIDADKCDFDILVKKFNKDPLKLKYHSNWKGFANNLQEIYNIDNSKQRVIY